MKKVHYKKNLWQKCYKKLIIKKIIIKNSVIKKLVIRVGLVGGIWFCLNYNKWALKLRQWLRPYMGYNTIEYCMLYRHHPHPSLAFSILPIIFACLDPCFCKEVSMFTKNVWFFYNMALRIFFPCPGSVVKTLAYKAEFFVLTLHSGFEVFASCEEV